MGEESVRRLVGWKEVAEYLGTSPRTAQRWEQEKSLPVHRVPGSNGHSVFAESDELDRWFASGGPDTVAAAASGSGQVPTQTSSDDIHGNPSTDSGRAGGVRIAPRRYPPVRVAAWAALAIVVVLGVGLVGERSALWHPSAAWTAKSASGAPAIASVTTIEPKSDQIIVIRGRNLGTYCYYANEDTPFIAIRDKTAQWAAGRIIPENWDEVTLNVARWTDSEIVVTGFAGAYGQHWWRLNRGDQIEVVVWNPQTKSGPATYALTVASPQLAQK